MFSRAFSDPRQTGWALVAAGSAVIAAIATRNALKAAWRAMRHEDPPLNPAAHDTEWPEAIAWTAATGLAAGLSRLVARRTAASGWYRVTGEWPPGL
jgi:hypothetical protein